MWIGDCRSGAGAVANNIVILSPERDYPGCSKGKSAEWTNHCFPRRNHCVEHATFYVGYSTTCGGGLPDRDF
jgi:hypothetical protein